MKDVKQFFYLMPLDSPQYFVSVLGQDLFVKRSTSVTAEVFFPYVKIDIDFHFKSGFQVPIFFSYS